VCVCVAGCECVCVCFSGIEGRKHKVKFIQEVCLCSILGNPSILEVLVLVQLLVHVLVLILVLVMAWLITSGMG